MNNKARLPEDENCEISLANARLIAAAPDLYEALKPLADIDIDHLGNATGEKDIEVNPDRPIIKILTVGDVINAKQAIAKAEGREE